MSRIDDIDAAFRRGQMLFAILKWAREQALANPAQSRWAKLGLMSAYETKQKSLSELNASFDQLFGVVEHLAIVDMASAFEVASRRRLATRIGEAHTALRASADRQRTVPHLDKLLRTTADFENLKTIEDFISQFVDGSMAEALALIRSARNNFAHGTNVLSAPVVEGERAKETLTEILALI